LAITTLPAAIADATEDTPTLNADGNREKPKAHIFLQFDDVVHMLMRRSIVGWAV
jgi:hypothetical protein